MPPTSLVRDDDLRRLAATVPRLLSVRVETATDTVTETVEQLVEQIAEGLLSWHDRLVGGPEVDLHLADAIHAPGTFRPRPGGLPDLAQLSVAATEFRRCAAAIQAVVQAVADDASRRAGQELSEAVRVLAELLGEHAEQIRELTGTDERRRNARLSVAERSLYRKVLATLRG